MPQHLAQQLEGHGREQEDDLPVHLEAPEQLPQAAWQAGEDERREVPDGFLGAQLAQPSAREAASDRERKRDELAGEQCGQGHRGAHDRAGIRAADEPDEKGALERQVCRVVMQQHA